jgi:mannose-1-phosphate guanylyltransferase
MIERYAVIMAGGKGERFWPLSTSEHPKQFLALVGDKPLIAQTMDRLQDLIPPERIFVITNADLTDATRAALPMLPPENVLGEPMGRDTAAAVACAGALIQARNPDAVFCVLPADQVIHQSNLFSSTLQAGMDLANAEDVLVTIGIQPTFPSSGFGYIEAGETLPSKGDVAFWKARRFVEKPDTETAEKYLDSGRFYWNAGMFIWSVSALHRAFSAHCPPMADLMDALTVYAQKNQLEEGMNVLYPALEKISVDYALMEKADNIVMACGEFDWDDVGAWPALENHFPADEDGNIQMGLMESVDAHGNITYSPDRLTALIGVDDLMVVQVEGVTLVCPKNRAQDIKKMVIKLREKGGFEHLL